MIKKTLWDFLRLVAFFGGIYFVFFVFMEVLPEKRRNEWFYKDNKTALLSIEQEILLGEKIEDFVFENDNELVNNKVIDAALWSILTRLEKTIEQTEYDYKVKIINSPEINAFTIPGGRIYINKGLIAFCDSPEQLAAVLAHEIGHVEKRHTVSKLIKEFGVALLFSILSGGDAVLLSDLFHATVSTAFDRVYETEADQYALKLLEQAEISPTAMASFFRKLNRDNLAYDEKIEFIMTHPHNNSRIKRALNYKVNEGFTSKGFMLDWEKVRKEAE